MCLWVSVLHNCHSVFCFTLGCNCFPSFPFSCLPLCFVFDCSNDRPFLSFSLSFSLSFFPSSLSLSPHIHSSVSFVVVVVVLVAGFLNITTINTTTRLPTAFLSSLYAAKRCPWPCLRPTFRPFNFFVLLFLFTPFSSSLSFSISSRLTSPGVFMPVCVRVLYLFCFSYLLSLMCFYAIIRFFFSPGAHTQTIPFFFPL